MDKELKKAISVIQITLHNVADELDLEGNHKDADIIDKAWYLIKEQVEC